MKRKRAIHGNAIERGSGNVYADLGYADSEDMFLKAQLVAKIADILRERRLTQEKAAAVLGLTQPKISQLMQGRFRCISERRLLRCLTRLGRDVQIVVRPVTHRRTGHLTVSLR